MGKKVLVVLLSILMIFSYSVSVKAATLNSDGDSVNVPVKYTVDNTEFLITIPAQLTLASRDVSFTVTSQRMNLRPDESVIVRITKGCNESGGVELVRQNDKQSRPSTLYTYLTINGKNIASNNYEVARFVDGDNSTTNTLGKVVMSAPVVTEDTKAGDYCGTIEFSVELRRE